MSGEVKAGNMIDIGTFGSGADVEIDAEFFVDVEIGLLDRKIREKL